MVDSKRLIPGFILICLILIFYYLKLDKVLILLLFSLSLFELFNTKAIHLKLATTFFIFFTLFIFFYEFLKNYNLILFFILLILIPIFFENTRFKKIIFSIILFIFLIFSYDLISKNRDYLYLIIFLSFFNDTIAFIAGKYFKGPLIAPRISPNKTWSGTFVSFSLTFSLMLLLNFGLIFSFFLSSLFFIGDLFFSYYKRMMNLKDFSNLLYGHGGILDRFDSVFLPIIFFNIYFFIP